MITTRSVLELVTSILPDIAREAERCEAERSVPVENFALIRDTGLFRLFQPRRYGGLEGKPQEFFDAVAAIGGACTSSGWVAGVLGEHQFVVAQFSERAQDDVWRDSPDNTVSGTFDPSYGKATSVHGGFVLNGTWKFASGCRFANWHSVGAMITDPVSDAKERALFLIPATDVDFIDTWNVGGLRGTASYDVAVKDRFIPEHRMLKIQDILSAQTPGRNVNTSTLYRVPVFSIIALGILAPVVGATSEAVATFITKLTGATRGGGIVGEISKAGDSPILQKLVAETSGLIAAVHALIKSGLDETWAQASDDALTIDRRVLNRRDYALAVRLCVQTVNALYENTGTTALYVPNALDRVWRDVNAAAKHHGLNWDAMGTMSGRYLLGLPPRGQF
jgi:alkylation response protein AidB-like acyl-CoA dehydrogenase